MRRSDLPEKAETAVFFWHAKTLVDFAFLLIPQFSMIAFTSAVEVLRMANYVMDEEVYRWSLLSPDGGPICASNGMSINTQAAKNIGRPHIVFAVGGTDAQRFTTEAHLAELRHFSRFGSIIGGICTGAHALAGAGLLVGYRSMSHWEDMVGVSEVFPPKQLFIVDRDRVICTGGLAPLDLMLNVTAARIGASRVERISEHFLIASGHGSGAAQEKSLFVPRGIKNPSVIRVIEGMEENIEYPLSLGLMAELASISERRLQRLFENHLGVSPSVIYSELRLRRARRLVLQTSLPLGEIAGICGFRSLSQFGRCYRKTFHLAPTDERKRATEF
jgi:transcriptional regulator GlxA family with amidase domain